MRRADKPAWHFSTMMSRNGSHWLLPQLLGASESTAEDSSDPVGALVLFESSEPVGAGSVGPVGAMVLFELSPAKCRRTAPRDTPSVLAILRCEYPARRKLLIARDLSIVS